MKIAFKLPNNEAFYGQYAQLSKTVGALGYLAQILAGLAEFAIIYALVRAKIAPVFPALAVPAGIVGGLAGVVLIEGGLRRFLPYAVRAILYRRFSGLHLVISGFVFAVVLALGLAHITLSFRGSKDLAGIAIKPPAPTDTAPVDSSAQAATAQANARWQADSLAVENRFAPLLAAAQSKAAALAAVQTQTLKRWEARERSEGSRYPTQKADARAQLAAIEAARAQETADIERQKAEALAEALAARNDAAGLAESERQRKSKEIEQANAEALAETLAQVEAYGAGLGWLTSVICLLVLIAAISIKEITHKGAEVEELAVPGTYDFSPGVWAEFLAMLSDKWNAYARRWISAQAEKTPPPPVPLEPAPLYELDNFSPPRIKPQRKANKAAQATEAAQEKENLYTRLFDGVSINGNGHHKNGNGKHPTGPQNRAAAFAYDAGPDVATYCNTPPATTAATGAQEAPRALIGFTTAGSGNALRYNASRYRLADCLQCGQKFEQKTTWQKYCSEDCRLNFHAARHDGQAFDPGKKRKGKKKGGRP